MSRGGLVAGERVTNFGIRIGGRIMTAVGLGGLVRQLGKFLHRQQPRHRVLCQEYSDWIQSFDTPSALDVGRHRDEMASFGLQPTISILMPVFRPDSAFLDAAIRSVRDQSYAHWELCITAEASSGPTVADVLRRHSVADARIKLHFRDAPGDVAAASNKALEMATGSYVAMLDHGDLLPPLALHWVVESINRYPAVRILYSDEDKVDEQGCRFDPHFKSDFNQVLLVAQNMISRLCVYRRDLVESVGGCRAGFEGAEDYDLVLRCVAEISRDAIVHIPRILYHRRAIAGGMALSPTEKRAAANAARRAVTEHVRGFDGGAVVEPAPEAPAYLRVRYSLPSPAPLVSIVICTRDQGLLLRTAIESIIDKTTYPNYEIVVLDNGSRDAAALDYLASITARPGITVIRDDSPFNYSRLNNTAVRHTRGQVLCLMNDDIEVLTPGWLEEMASFAVLPHVGAVGARLWYPDGTLQHGGVIIGICGVAGHAHLRLGRNKVGYFSRGVLQQELSAVTGACLMVRRDVFDEVGGLEEQIAVAFNDVDLCLRIRGAGYRNIWTPFAELIHHESASRGYEDNPEKHARFLREISFMQNRWGAALGSDPYYNPNLSMRAGDYALESSGPAMAPWKSS